MDEEVARLVREERLVEAAELASSRGDARTASTLFERASATTVTRCCASGAPGAAGSDRSFVIVGTRSIADA